MPINPNILDELARAGSHIVIDATSTSLSFVVKYWTDGTGNVTIRNASQLNPNNAVAIANKLKNRLTLEE